MDIIMASSGSKHLFASHPASSSSKKHLLEDQLIAVNYKMCVHLGRQLWQLHIETAADDWSELILNVVLCLMSSTDMKDSIITATAHLADDVAEHINEDKSTEYWAAPALVVLNS
jgi:hypothetical protein